MTVDVVGGFWGRKRRKRARRVITESEEDTLSEEEGGRHRVEFGLPVQPTGDTGGSGEGLVGPQDAPA